MIAESNAHLRIIRACQRFQTWYAVEAFNCNTVANLWQFS